MAIFLEHKNRMIIPIWRDFKTTLKQNELGINSDNNGKVTHTRQEITDNILAWNEHKTIGYAADLLNSAISLDLNNIPEVLDAANFIKENPQKASRSLLDITQIFLGINGKEVINDIQEVQDINNYTDKLFHKPLRDIRQQINEYPFNPINWVELSRLHTILGHKHKAQKSMLVALNLGKNNRYILRSAARLFIHLEDVEYAHKIIKMAEATPKDPWLLASEIAIAQLRNRNSKFLKSGLNIVNSKNYSLFSITELSSALATFELMNGSFKKSKTLFSLSLEMPNDNSLAQAEWAMSFNNRMDFSQNNISENLINSNEALAFNAYAEENWGNTLLYTSKWFLEQPFSKRPVIIGSFVSSLIDEHETSVRFCKLGLQANPNDVVLLNNLAYALLILNRIDEAHKILEQIKNIGFFNLTNETKITNQATLGLLCFRLGKIQEGRSLYLRAIENAKNIKNNYFAVLAMINLAREEILVKTDFVDTIIQMLNEAVKKVTHSEIAFMKSKIDKMYNEYKASKTIIYTTE